MVTACSDGEEGPSTGDGGGNGLAAAGHGGESSSRAGDGPGGTGTQPSATLSPFEAWREVRAALRESPDHLPSRAERLVSERDPVALFEFVRDEIVTYPPAEDGFTGVMRAHRWGTRATLRGGAGTPREKVDLLIELYRAAGFEAEVVRAQPDPEQLAGEDVLLRNVAREFALDASEERLALWGQAFGHDVPTEPRLIDADGEAGDQLMQDILAQLPPGQAAAFDFTLNEMPLVAVTIAGERRYANVIAPDAEFGDTLARSEPRPYTSTALSERVLVRVEASRSDTPRERFSLLEADYAIEDLTGRSLQLSFPPPVDFAQLSRMRLADIEAVLPVLTVAHPDLSDEERKALTKHGDVVTLGGDVIRFDADGAASLNGEPLPVLASDSDATERVHALDGQLDTAGYPRLELTVSASDAGGLPVTRLGAPAFLLEDTAQPVSFSLRRVEPPNPRVILVFDNSNSVAAEFRHGGAVTIATEIASALYDANAATQLQVGTINFGYDPVATAWATSEAEALEQIALLETASGSSEIFQAASEASALGPTLLVMVSDGANTDSEQLRYTSQIANGPPIVLLNVSAAESPALQRIADLSGGSTRAVEQQTEVVSIVVETVREQEAESYVLSFAAPEGGPSEREVQLTVNGVARGFPYEVPAEPQVPRAVSSLYLTLELAGRTVSRPIAGLAEGDSSAFPVITAAMLADVQSTLRGRVSISFEGAGPSPSVLLDDYIGRKLALEPLYDAIGSADDAAILDALKTSVIDQTGSLPLALAPLDGTVSPDGLTFETGPQVALSVQKVPDAAPVWRSLDLFSLSRWATAAPDAEQAFQRTLRITAGLAIREAALLGGSSTYEALDGKALSLLVPSAAVNQEGLTAEQRRQWSALVAPFPGSRYRLLAPLEPGPFWAIDLNTGTVLGIMPDGSAGAYEDLCLQYKVADALLNIAGYIGAGTWAAIGQWEVKNLTMAMLVMFHGAPYPGIGNIGAEIGCNAVLDDLGGDFPPYRDYGAGVWWANTLHIERPDGGGAVLHGPCDVFGATGDVC